VTFAPQCLQTNDGLPSFWLLHVAFMSTPSARSLLDTTILAQGVKLCQHPV
jgi:hypothetical protein